MPPSSSRSSPTSSPTAKQLRAPSRTWNSPDLNRPNLPVACFELEGAGRVNPRRRIRPLRDRKGGLCISSWRQHAIGPAGDRLCCVRKRARRVAVRAGLQGESAIRSAAGAQTGVSLHSTSRSIKASRTTSSSNMTSRSSRSASARVSVRSLSGCLIPRTTQAKLLLRLLRSSPVIRPNEPTDGTLNSRNQPFPRPPGTSGPRPSLQACVESGRAQRSWSRP